MIHTHSLHDVRSDGWFERLGDGAPSFGQLCDIVGSRFVAFAVVAGVRITAVGIDERNQDASQIDFRIGDEGSPQRLALGEFRQRLAAALASDDGPHGDLPAAPTREQLSAFLGHRYVLLCPIFGVELRTLTAHPDVPARLSVRIDGADAEQSVEELREHIRRQILAEAERHRPRSPFSIDITVVARAREAAERGENDLVIDLLKAWPNPLSTLLRTAEANSLATEVRATLAEGLALLGSAYAGAGRHEWGQDVLRLGIQWAQDGAVGGDLFRRLGEALCAEGRHGEAIGLFRRALALGATGASVLPSLAKAFGARHRHLAALAVADAARAAGASDASVEEVTHAAREALGETWSRLAAQLASSA